MSTAAAPPEPHPCLRKLFAGSRGCLPFEHALDSPLDSGARATGQRGRPGDSFPAMGLQRAALSQPQGALRSQALVLPALEFPGCPVLGCWAPGATPSDVGQWAPLCTPPPPSWLRKELPLWGSGSLAGAGALSPVATERSLQVTTGHQASTLESCEVALGPPEGLGKVGQSPGAAPPPHSLPFTAWSASEPLQADPAWRPVLHLEPHSLMVTRTPSFQAPPVEVGQSPSWAQPYPGRAASAWTGQGGHVGSGSPI